MEKYHGTALSIAGPAIPEAEVTVYDLGTEDLATIYADNGVTSKSNPLTTGIDGEYNFYAANGRYTLVTVKAGFATDTRTDVMLFDFADVDYVAPPPEPPPEPPPVDSALLLDGLAIYLDGQQTFFTA